MPCGIVRRYSGVLVSVVGWGGGDATAGSPALLLAHSKVIGMLGIGDRHRMEITDRHAPESVVRDGCGNAERTGCLPGDLQPPEAAPRPWDGGQDAQDRSVDLTSRGQCQVIAVLVQPGWFTAAGTGATCPRIPAPRENGAQPTNDSPFRVRSDGLPQWRPWRPRRIQPSPRESEARRRYPSPTIPPVRRLDHYVACRIKPPKRDFGRWAPAKGSGKV